MTTLTTVENFICEVIIFIACAIVTIICGMVDTSDCLLAGALIWLAGTISLDMLVEVKDDEE
jgi:hypothetical protein